MTEIISKPIDFGDSEDAEAKRLMKEWGVDGDVGDVSDNEDDLKDLEFDDYDDFLEKFRRDLNPGDNEIDHIILGTSNLEQSLEEFENMTGSKPVMVVSLNGVGTKSARIAFEDCCFLEIMGPDPKQSMPLGNKLSKLPSGKMVPLHYAIRSSRAQQTPWADKGLECDMVSMVAKDRGQLWKWDMHIIEGHSQGGLLPYIVDWGDAHHAAGRLPIVGNLNRVKVQSSSSSPVHDLVLGTSGVFADEGADLLEFTFTSAKGTHTFSCSDPIGISFPK